MADITCTSAVCDVHEIKKLLWGTFVKEDVFRRWSQGFEFSADEPSALVQLEGGPCAVLAPIQAYLLKCLLGGEVVDNNWREVDSALCYKLLVRAICDILVQTTRTNNGRKFVIVYRNETKNSSPTVFCNGEMSTGEITSNNKNTVKNLINVDDFHSMLRLANFESIQEVEEFLLQRIESLQDTYGTLLVLYSIISTKGVDQILKEMNDASDPLIDAVYGYGSQSLINLMITGRAVAHVWNHDQDVGGLKLHGIDCQSDVGFLALLEHMRYCEVGSFLKNPKYPIWVLGSETHLTVLFSMEKRLVKPETPRECAQRIFKMFDRDGNNFIDAGVLQEVLRSLELVCESEYVSLMSKRLDPENLGIILLNTFLDEFYPEETPPVPDTFTLYHYNGLSSSSHNGKVFYQEGHAVLLESDIQCVLENNPILTCLQTKWPNIEIRWVHSTPSLN